MGKTIYLTSWELKLIWEMAYQEWERDGYSEEECEKIEQLKHKIDDKRN